MIRDIFNTYREAFRQWVRSKTRPKTVFEAEEKRLFWSKCYLFSVIGAIGIYFFQSYKENKGFGSDSNNFYAMRLARGINQNEPVRIIKYSGLQRVSDETINVKEFEKNYSIDEEGNTVKKVS